MESVLLVTKARQSGLSMEQFSTDIVQKKLDSEVRSKQKYTFLFEFPGINVGSFGVFGH